MPTTTTRFSFIKPANGEYQDNWDQPMNSNWDKADTEIYANRKELTDARGNKASLKARLDGGLDADGNLLATPEVERGRNSPISGQYTSLALRLDSLDLDLGIVRTRESSFIEGLSYFSMHKFMDKVISAQSNFITYSGAIIKVDGDPDPVIANCGGFPQICRVEEDLPISGAAGTKFIYAQRNSAGRTISTSITGATGGGSLNEFNDTAGQFVTKGVVAGDYLVINSGANAGSYVVDSVVDENNLVIKGKFVSSLSNQNYTLLDMFHPSISYESTRAPADGKCYLGECFFDGANITSAYAYTLRGEYESSYQAVDVSAVPTFELVIQHKLGFIPKSIKIYASQTDSENDYHELLSVGNVSNDYVFNFNDGGSGATLSVTGGNFPTRNVIARVTRKEIHIKNPRNNLFYTDYLGVDRDSGYLKVVLGR